jgi:hypothetical protein
LKIKILYPESKKILFIVLLFLFYTAFSQKIAVENKSSFAIDIQYNNRKIHLTPGNKNIISEKEINYLKVRFDNKNKSNLFIPVFLTNDESLELIIQSDNKPVEFKGDKGLLHNYIVNQQHSILYKNVFKYQEIYNKNKNQELINFSELILAEYLNKIKSLNNSPLGTKDERYQRIEKYVVNDWISSLYLILTGNKNLSIRSKELVLYYYNKYLQKDIQQYNCDYRPQYEVMSVLAKYSNQLNITLPKYAITEHTENDAVNQYLPKKCQAYYFKIQLKYYDAVNSEKKKYYEKVLKEKFNDQE